LHVISFLLFIFLEIQTCRVAQRCPRATAIATNLARQRNFTPALPELVPAWTEDPAVNGSIHRAPHVLVYLTEDSYGCINLQRADY
jgi:hypothetical protein